MKKTTLALNIALLFSSSITSSQVFAQSEIELMRAEMQKMQEAYEKRMGQLEQRLQKAEQAAKAAKESAQTAQNNIKTQLDKPRADMRGADNQFNPAISVILDGRFADFKNEPENYELPGFVAAGEAGLGKKGFSVNHTEILASANIDDKFYGQLTTALHEHDGAIEVELEEAFIQTLGLGNGVTLKAGRFFSGLGYLNSQHQHAWDFADAPLIYRGLFGNQLRDDGVQATWIAPTDIFLELGAELTKGSRFPGSGDHDGIGAWSAFANIGGDFGVEHSWQAGIGHWQSDVENRQSTAHAHGAEEAHEEHAEEAHEEHTPSYTGKTQINSAYVVYKWAPNGNPKNKNLKLQFEYFQRREDGDINMMHGNEIAEMSSYDGDHKGWYAQAVYQFQPQWRAGVRYDAIEADNKGGDMEIIEEAGLSNEGHKPKRYSAMLEWLPSEFSRVRLQFNRDKSYHETDNQVFLQYTHSFGSHGAHKF